MQTSSLISIGLSLLIIASDFYARRVPNAWLLASLLMAAGIMIMEWHQGTGGPWWPAVLGLLAGLATLLPFHIFGLMGAGDVKFFAVLGFLLGAKALLPIWVIASLVAGAHTVLILLSRHASLRVAADLDSVQHWFSTSSFGQRMAAARGNRKGLPYAAWLGVGALITIFNPELMRW